ncbi:MAG: S8/S53 family peptidase [Myroides sp.]
MKNKITKLFIVLMLSGFAVNAQTPEERQLIIKDYDLEKLKSLEKQAREDYEKGYEKAVQIARKKGLPITGVDSEGKKFSLQGIIDGTEDELRYYTSYNNTATKSSIQTARVQHVHNGTATGGVTIEGQTIILGIWDGGAVYAGHQSIGASRVTPKDNNTTIHDHASHVAGTMIANGVINDIKGMAPQALLWSNDYNGDRPEMIAQSGQGLLLSNHSYGTNYVLANYQNNPGVFGKYTNSARLLDELLFTADNYLPVIAAGNARNGLLNAAGTAMVYFNVARGGADLMEGEAVSKNAVVVAAVEGVTNYTQASDVVMSGFSQWGPTDDFRIKPDISAKGVAVMSLGIGSVSDTDIMQGTSMAAPSVTGVFGLWQHYYKVLYPTRVRMRAATVKALMAISADEAGLTDGPDHRFGWGLINARKGAEILRDSKPAIDNSKVIEETLNNGSVYEIQVKTNGTTVLRAALAWTDPAGNTVAADNSITPVLVNDLDLRIIRPNGDEALPWALTKDVTLLATRKDNDVDPIEVVEYKGAATQLAGAGTYTIRVTHKGTLTNGSQKFSLIVSGVGETVSVKEQQFDNLVVYPNPVNDIVTLKADLASIVGANTQIFDMSGKQVYENNDLFNNTNEASVNISFLNSGIYLLKLSNGEINQTIKIVKK